MIDLERWKNENRDPREEPPASETLDPVSAAFYEDLLAQERALKAQFAYFERIITPLYRLQPGDQIVPVLEEGRVVGGRIVRAPKTGPPGRVGDS